MKTIYTLLITLILIPNSSSAISLTLGDVKDTRTTGQFFAGLDINLKLIGDDVDSIRGIKTTYTSVLDDAGKNLVDPKKVNDKFQEFNQGGFNQNSISLQLKNPKRAATKIKELRGELILFKPSLDPMATVSIPSFLSTTGKPIENEGLKQAGISCTVQQKAGYDAEKEEKKQAAKNAGSVNGMFGGFMQVSENDLVFKISDPNNKIVDYEVVDSSDKPIRTQSSMTLNEVKIMSFSSAVPEDAKLVFYLATEKAIEVTPFSFDGVVLP